MRTTGRFTDRLHRGTLAAGLAFGLTIAALPAQTVSASTFPGENGLLVYPESIVLPSGEFSRDIVVVAADGTHRKKLTDDDLWDDSPAWSPDGRRIAFGSKGREGDGTLESQIYVMDADGSNITRVSGDVDASYGGPSFAPDGASIVAGKYDPSSSKSTIIEIDLATSAETLVYESPWPTETPGAPTFSPDGSAVAFVTISTSSLDSAVWVRGAGTEFHVDGATDPCWEPDGSGLLISRRSNKFEGGRDVWWMNADGSGLRLVTEDLDAACPSPDGTMLAGIDNDTQVWVVGADGSSGVPVPGATSIVTPQWQPADEPLVPPTTTSSSSTTSTTADTAAVATTPRYAG